MCTSTVQAPNWPLGRLTTHLLCGIPTQGGEGQLKLSPCPLLPLVFPCSPVHTLVGHRAEISSLAFNYEGTMVATASMDKTCKLWDTRSGKLIHTLRSVSMWSSSCVWNV